MTRSSSVQGIAANHRLVQHRRRNVTTIAIMRLSVAALVLGGSLVSVSSLSSTGFRMDGAVPNNGPGTSSQFNEWDGSVYNMNSPPTSQEQQQRQLRTEELQQQQQQQFRDTAKKDDHQSSTAYSDLLASTFQPSMPKQIFSSPPTENESPNLSDNQLLDILGYIDSLAFGGMTPSGPAAATNSIDGNDNRADYQAEDEEEEELVLPFSATRANPGVDGFNPVLRPIAFTSDNNPASGDYFNAADTPTPTATAAAAAAAAPAGRRQQSTPPRSSFVGSSSSSTELRMQTTATTDSEFGTRGASASVNGNRNNNGKKDDDNEGDDELFFADEPVLGDGSTLSERMLRKVPVENQAGGAGGVSTLEGFMRAEANWARLKTFKPFTYDKKLLRWTQDGHGPPPQFVATDGAFGSPRCWAKLRDSIEKELDFDVVICGGTLGIFFATYLQLQGHDVCVIEAGKLRGREQEWNISMDELLELLDLGILTQEDIDEVISTEFPACRSGFKNSEVTPLKGGYFDNGIGYECFTPDVLNLGVAPALLLERVAKRFTDLGGVIKEQTRLSGVCVSELIGSALDLGENEEPVTARLVLDCMGNASPISAQQRYGQKADGICAVVGSCAGGYDRKTNLYGDIIYTNQPIVTRKGQGSNQYFWEAFPVGIGRGKAPGTSDVKTTYMFTYMDAEEGRPSLLQLMEDYWKLLPEYQPSIQNPETDLDVKRILFAFFPTYRDSPLKPEFSRVLAVGDASGIQSPLSFGGFGALTRHLARVGGAISEALETDCLHKDDLGEINAYQPDLSAAWMFQKAMSVKMGQKVDPKFVNRLLATNFQVMDEMGETTMKPFLQDVVRFDGLVGSLARSFVADPTFMPQIVNTVGVPELVNWLGHLGSMGTYSVLDSAAGPIGTIVDKLVKNPRDKFQWRRRIESWKYGSGMDYKFSNEQNESTSN